MLKNTIRVLKSPQVQRYEIRISGHFLCGNFYFWYKKF